MKSVARDNSNVPRRNLRAPDVVGLGNVISPQLKEKGLCCTSRSVSSRWAQVNLQHSRLLIDWLQDELFERNHNFLLFNKAKRLAMTEALLMLNGIISITYDIKKCHCLIRAKSHMPDEVFGKSIANLGFECHLVTRVDNDDEVTNHLAHWLCQSFTHWSSRGFEPWQILIKMEPDPKLDNSTSVYDQENWSQGQKSPQYLSDTDSETSFQEAKETQAVASGESGLGTQKPNKGGWFSSAANFIQKSLYW